MSRATVARGVREIREADVIVVGAGPGGSAAAYHLARHGCAVLLLEKTEFPREKVCGDGLTPRAVKQLVTMGVDTQTPGWLRNKGLRVIGGGIRLELDWPDLASFPNYGLTRTRLDFDDMLAKRAVDGRRDAAHQHQRHRPGARRAHGRVVGVEADGRPGQGAARRTGRRWWSPPTASPAGSRSRWAWPSATTGRSAWRSAGTTSSPPGTTTTTWSRGWSCAASERRRQAAARLRLDLRDGRRPGQRRPGRAQLVGRVRQDQLPRAC